MRGIRGAITVKKNESRNILSATQKLLKRILRSNNIEKNEIVSIIFTATEDLDKEYPAVAARKMGLENIPLMCYQELNIENSLNKCIRIMVYINRNCSLDKINHVYLKKAQNLRPDLVEENKNDM